MERDDAAVEDEEVKVDTVRTRLRAVKEESRPEVDMLASDADDDGEVRYVSVGRPARLRRSKVLAERRRGLSKKRGRVSKLLANWNRLNGQGCN